MRILIASAEFYPFSKTGGLADMVAALAKSLAKAGHRVGVVTPLYRGLREQYPEIRRFDWRISLPLGYRTVNASVWTLRLRRGLTLYFIDQPEFYQRGDLYQENGAEYGDNPERFAFFSKCVAQMARYLPWHPEIVHVHDWHAGLTPLLIKHQSWYEGWQNPPPTCLTIHNLAYQGNCDAAKYHLTNLPWTYFQVEGVEFYGRFSFLKTGLVFADALTTVSPRYAREITTPELGCGLDGLLRARQAVLAGILNGADYEEWRTTRNPFLPYPYTARNLGGKARNKRALQAALGLPLRPGAPLFGSVTRLTDQKGVDIALGALHETSAGDQQFVLLGSGHPEFQDAFVQLERRYPSKVAIRIGYDQKLAHLIEAGSDFFLMPSRFEPCGLNQMYSLRYGTLPVVRATGGLDDSVIDLRENLERANGIKFHDYSQAALAKAMHKAHVLFQEPGLLHHLRRNAMSADFSWAKTAEHYLAVYERLLSGSPSAVSPGSAVRPARGTGTRRVRLAPPLQGANQAVGKRIQQPRRARNGSRDRLT